MKRLILIAVIAAAGCSNSGTGTGPKFKGEPKTKIGEIDTPDAGVQGADSMKDKAK